MSRPTAGSNDQGARFRDVASSSQCARGASRPLGGCSSAAQLAKARADRGGWAALTVAVEKLLDAGLFLDDLVGRPCTLYELFLGRDLVEHVLRRRAFNVR